MDVTVSREDYRVVQTHAEIDLSNVATLRAALDEAVKDCPQGFVIDLSGSRYIDSSGIAAIVAAYRRVHSQGGGLALVAPDHYLRRILAIINLHTLPSFFICDTVDEAHKALAVPDKA
ncbi:MAG TPA: STAS domain-containing protein [Armatimonadota bacterium]|jgi:anti-sigma B factor antagonist